jgi:hypothetical protein
MPILLHDLEFITIQSEEYKAWNMHKTNLNIYSLRLSYKLENWLYSEGWM